MALSSDGDAIKVIHGGKPEAKSFRHDLRNSDNLHG